MEHDPFRPHWTHKQCDGVVTGVGDNFKCLKCNTEGNRLGAVLPSGTTNSPEYFNCHPDLEVDFVNGDVDAFGVDAPAQSSADPRPAPMTRLLRWLGRIAEHVRRIGE
ncbi:MAG TPA: hypothetical protein VHU83_11665 [Bryobacteraceae bacterium]|jgi:hypothetical protein|nr:hypothetical protein [Bryobacteraceae bacterium]